MPSQPLPRLRVRRKPWNLARIASRFVPALGAIEAQREPWAQYWDDRNRAALEQDGPLWVAFGDSMAQGIGASAPDRGFVPRVHERLIAETGDPWRVVNLAMTGARVRHVVEEQLPALAGAGLEPDLATCMVGFNDFIGGTRLPDLERHALAMVAGLPVATLVGRVSTARFRRRATVLAEVLEAADRAGRIVIIDPWRWPDANGVLAADRFHLNDKGYAYVADAVFDAMVEHAGV